MFNGMNRKGQVGGRNSLFSSVYTCSLGRFCSVLAVYTWGIWYGFQPASTILFLSILKMAVRRHCCNDSVFQGGFQISNKNMVKLKELYLVWLIHLTADLHEQKYKFRPERLFVLFKLIICHNSFIAEGNPESVHLGNTIYAVRINISLYQRGLRVHVCTQMSLQGKSINIHIVIALHETTDINLSLNCLWH